MQTLHEYLATLMIAAQVTRPELGRRTGIARQTIARWLTGERTPGVADLCRILDAVSATDAARLRCLRIAK